MSGGFFTNEIIASCADTVSLKMLSQQPDNDGYFMVGECKPGSSANSLNVSYKITQQSTGSNLVYTGKWIKQ